MDILQLDDHTRLTSSRSVKTSDVNQKTCHVLWRIELIGESESGKSVQSTQPDDDDDDDDLIVGVKNMVGGEGNTTESY